MKVIIAAQIKVSADKRENALSAAAKVIEKIIMQTGCVRYDWAADCSDPELITVFEEWEDQSALDQHFAGPNFAKMNALLGEVGVLGAAAKKYAVEREASVFGADGSPSSSFE
ncbi:MAG: putative quinol monooxygenase [Hyphomonadaceae bacterium]